MPAPAEPTAAEHELERILNALGNGVLSGEFEREWVCGAWRVDFYFPAIKLAIEVDGGYHRAQSRWRKDLQKTADLDAQGIIVLRLTNAEVLGDRERLVARLRLAWRVAQQRNTPPGFTAREPDAPDYSPVFRPAGLVLAACRT